MQLNYFPDCTYKNCEYCCDVKASKVYTARSKRMDLGKQHFQLAALLFILSLRFCCVFFVLLL